MHITILGADSVARAARAWRRFAERLAGARRAAPRARELAVRPERRSRPALLGAIDDAIVAGSAPGLLADIDPGDARRR